MDAVRVRGGTVALTPFGGQVLGHEIQLWRIFPSRRRARAMGLLGGCASLRPGVPSGGRQRRRPSLRVSEVRVGGLAHDPLSPEAGGADLSGEVLFAKPFTSPDPLWNALAAAPRYRLHRQFRGKDQRAYAGVAWD